MYHPTQVKGHSRKLWRFIKGPSNGTFKESMVLPKELELGSCTMKLHSPFCSLTYVVTGGETTNSLGLRMEKMTSRGQDFQSNWMIGNARSRHEDTEEGITSLPKNLRLGEKTPNSLLCRWRDPWVHIAWTTNTSFFKQPRLPSVLVRTPNWATLSCTLPGDFWAHWLVLGLGAGGECQPVSSPVSHYL